MFLDGGNRGYFSFSIHIEWYLCLNFVTQNGKSMPKKEEKFMQTYLFTVEVYPGPAGSGFL